MQQVGLKTTRVLLRTKTQALGRGLAALAGGLDDLEVHTTSADLPQMIDAVMALRPNVIIMDTGLHVDFACLSELRNRVPECRIVLWVESISVEIAHHARAAGVVGILRKDASDELLLTCMRKVSEGEFWFERSLMSALLKVHHVRLSPREQQLLMLVAQGLSNKQLANDLAISEGTVKVYLAKLFRKVGVHDRYELAMQGLRSLGVATVEPNDIKEPYPSFLQSVVIHSSRHTETH